ncbi:MAG TPA: AAA family ATPase [Euzebya sp.]|nr:AAA family ATPase [Euzebya sp.]
MPDAPAAIDGADQQRLDGAYDARDVLAERLAQTSRPALDQYADSILYAIRSDAVRRMQDGWTPFFGRIDTDEAPDESGEGGRAWIGPYAVHAEDNRLLVQSWRAPASAGFYEATAADPRGVLRRRRFAIEGDRITGMVEEDLAAGQDDFDTLRRAIIRQVLQTRTGSMQDIMTTITPEQHTVIRADTPVTVLQGGPGTGKTAVGLHRIAYLLFAQPDLDALIVGPSDRFITYVSQVLPALGEDNVRHLTLAQLGQDPEGLRLVPKAPRDLLGDGRMAGLLEEAAWAVTVTDADLPVIRVRDRRVTLTPGTIADLLADARTAQTRPVDARAHFRDGLVGYIAGRLERRLGLLPSSDVIADIRASRGLAGTLRAVWPALDSTILLRRSLNDPELLSRHFSPTEAAVLHRAVIGTTRPRPADTLLTALHELAGEVLGEAFDGRRYGHIVADEAQELTPVELRMIRRRMTASGQITLLGDLSQHLGPVRDGLADQPQRSWAGLVGAAGLAAASMRTLDVSYRVPADLLDLAAPFAADPSLVPQGVRPSQTPPMAVATTDLAAAVSDLARRHPDDTVGVIVPEGLLVQLASAQLGTASLVPLPEMHGLEFGHVILVEPAAVLREGGPGGLYIAITRAVKSLVMVHRQPLPAALSDALEASGAGVGQAMAGQAG